VSGTIGCVLTIASIMVCGAAAQPQGVQQSHSGAALHAPFGLDSGVTPLLRQSQKPTQYFLDQFGPSVQPFGKTVKMRSGVAITVRGWAVDAQAARLAGGVEIVIDSQAYKLPYFLTRVDVAAALRTEAYTDSGFLGIVSPELLAKGSHTVSLRILSADRTTYYQSPPFRLVVLPI
jgi:hypothetical protein